MYDKERGRDIFHVYINMLMLIINQNVSEDGHNIKKNPVLYPSNNNDVVFYINPI